MVSSTLSEQKVTGSNHTDSCLGFGALAKLKYYSFRVKFVQESILKGMPKMNTPPWINFLILC